MSSSQSLLDDDEDGHNPLLNSVHSAASDGTRSLQAPRRLPIVAHGGRLNIKMRGATKKMLYFKDLFHTLVNIPAGRFFFLFCAVYLFQFSVFGTVYWMLPPSCIVGDPGGGEHFSFAHAIFFSVRTAMTIGYSSDFAPNGDCLAVNSLVTCQAVASRIIDYAMLGVVYARFSSPAHRAGTIRFSKHVIMHEVDGVWRLTMRVANLRKHQLLNPQIRMLLAIDCPHTVESESVFHFEDLELTGEGKDGCLALFLGLPASVTHEIGEGSPLHGLTLADMEERDMEILVLMDGVDATTSHHVQARHSYLPSDVMARHHFQHVVSRTPTGHRGVDFELFDAVHPVVEHYPPSPPTPPSESFLGGPLPPGGRRPAAMLHGLGAGSARGAGGAGGGGGWPAPAPAPAPSARHVAGSPGPGYSLDPMPSTVGGGQKQGGAGGGGGGGRGVAAGEAEGGWAEAARLRAQLAQLAAAVAAGGAGAAVAAAEALAALEREPERRLERGG